MDIGTIEKLGFSTKGQHPDTVFVTDGTYWMGSDKHYPEEAPVHRVRQTPSSFSIDQIMETLTKSHGG